MFVSHACCAPSAAARPALGSEWDLTGLSLWSDVISPCRKGAKLDHDDAPLVATTAAEREEATTAAEREET